MAKPKILTPAPGSRIVKDGAETILFGQPPEVLKGLLREGISNFDTLVLTDVREKNGSLMNNLEFPFYFFLFIAKGLAENRKINLIGDSDSISQALRLLRFTLMGPIRKELELWNTEDELKEEWLAVSEYLALKDDTGKVIPIEDFFNPIPFVDGLAVTDGISIEHKGTDHYLVRGQGGDVEVNLNSDHNIEPPYPVPIDYVPGGLTKMGIEVLGGASGFAIDEPCTGLALCYNGDYMLIDSIPFLDAHLYARGISKNQISCLFLTHLHDDHCSMFPLMEMPHKVDVITTVEIYQMAMEKLSCSLGWSKSVVEEHFQLIKVAPGDTINFYGLSINIHNTVHSIPTIGATFSAVHQGHYRDICIVGDNQNMSAVRDMEKAGIVRPSTVSNLDHMYTHNFHLLIADGGAGAIHGDPADALNSKAERVVFVHVDKLPEELNTTFSLASSGKRYTLWEGNSSIYTSQINHYLTLWLGQPFPNRWMRNLLAEQEIYRYNTEDVIIAQNASTHGAVYLLLTGYCDVIHYDGEKRHSIATLQAGDVIGEMAILIGSGVRNASAVARTPVTVCVFGEETFRNFIQHSGLQDSLESRWLLRPVIKLIPQYAMLSSSITERISRVADWQVVESGEKISLDDSHLYIFVEGDARITNSDGSTTKAVTGNEFGWRPFTNSKPVELYATDNCGLIKLEAETYLDLLKTVPQLNYQTRKQLAAENPEGVDWLLGEVPIYQNGSLF
jgi:CRP-like cAMP-binding protein